MEKNYEKQIESRGYATNAKIVGKDLPVRDSNGNIQSGRYVSNGDKITVLDIGYTKQLVLVEYPTASGVREGYISNDRDAIKYDNPYNWVNGSTPEIVYLSHEGSAELGRLDPREKATLLYKKGSRYHVAYDTPSKGPLSKSGYVNYAGGASSGTIGGDTNITIPVASHPQATKIQYGTSGKGRPLNVYRIGSGSKVLFAGFALHGWEDEWPNDGLALVKIANDLVSRIGDYKSNNGLHGWTVYIAPCMNPDGVIISGQMNASSGSGNNGPGRCAVTTRVDMNRCFPYNFQANYSSRNYTGASPLGAPEAIALKNFVQQINGQSSEMVVLDFHGWMNFTQGNSELGKYFGNQFGFGHNNGYSSGFFSSWATTLKNTKAVLIEYPKTTSYDQVISRNYIGKTYSGIINMIKANGGSDSGNGGGSGSGNGNIVVGSKVKIIGTNWATGQLIPSWAKNETYTVSKIEGDRALLQEVTSWIYLKDIVLVSGGGSSNSDLKPGEESYNKTGKIINVSTELNVRSGPGTSYNAIGKLYGGNTVTIVARVKPSGESLYWYKINHGSGTGYVRSDFVDVENNNSGNDTPNANRYIAKGEIINVSSTLNVRSGAGTSYSVLGTLRGGDNIDILEKLKPNGETLYWYKIKFNSGVGYVRSDFVKILYRDVTEDLRGLMVRYEYMYGPQWNGIDSTVASLASFYLLVRNNSIVDLKNQGWTESNYYFDGNLYRGDAPGNILYGYLGKVFGFKDELLLRAAGLAQQQSGTSKPEWGGPTGNPPYGDDPYDQDCIKVGIKYFNDHRKQ